MSNPLFNRFGGNQYQAQPPRGNGMLGLLSQFRQLQNDPGKILDVLLGSGKINQQQYNELQPVRNNPQQILNYLASHGNSTQINQATQMASQLANQLNK